MDNGRVWLVVEQIIKKVFVAKTREKGLQGKFPKGSQEVTKRNTI